ncbi:MAG TPA: hypothetical protein VIJ92_08125 [Ginsengibacter sp.]
MKTKIKFYVLLSLIVIASCTSTGGDNNDSAKFIGSWERIGGQPLTEQNFANSVITISKPGDNFIVVIAQTQKQFNATYDNGKDKLVANTDRGTQDIVFNNDTHHLTFEGLEFENLMGH